MIDSTEFISHHEHSELWAPLGVHEETGTVSVPMARNRYLHNMAILTFSYQGIETHETRI